jgi:hypothetical protein
MMPTLLSIGLRRDLFVSFFALLFSLPHVPPRPLLVLPLTAQEPHRTQRHQEGPPAGHQEDAQLPV